MNRALQLLLCAVLLLAAWPSRAQRPAAGRDDRRLVFTPLAGGTEAWPDSTYRHLPGRPDSFRVDVFRCYLSGIRLMKGGKVVYADAAAAHLLDLENPASFSIVLPGSAGLDCDAVRFVLGIDSATNAAGAGAGPLDPVNGMYWAWQSGYINLKLEGVSPLCESRRHQFHYHLGGFREGQLCARQLELPVNGSGPVAVSILLDRFLEAVDLRKDPTIMSPGAEAVRLSALAAAMFVTKTVGP